jgi:hypothetical protein
VLNLYGITFITDDHIESLASGCMQLECVALYYCSRFKGYSLKTLMSRCRKMKSLLLQNTGIENDAIKAVEWGESSLAELDLTSTDLDEPTLSLILNNLPALTYLSVANCDGFTDRVFQSMVKNNKTCNWESLDISHTVNLSYEEVYDWIKKYGNQLKGFAYAGSVNYTEQFWFTSIKNMKNIQ